MDKYNKSVQHNWFHHATWGDSKYKSEGVGKVLWHSLTESGKVEVVDIKFGNKTYENVSVKHLNPTDEGSHSHKRTSKELGVKKKKSKKESVMSSKLEELVGKPITEEQFDEAAGKKDACYRKVKARYDVWPSAYASGALVKCRKVGAANWGNKSKKEGLGDRMSKRLKKLKGVNLKKKKIKLRGKSGRGKISHFGMEETVNEARGTCWVGYQQLGMKRKGGKMVPNCVKEVTELYYEVDGKGYGYTFEYINDGKLNEAEYQGRKVKLGKVMQGDVKKFKVYVKNPKGNVVKVNFGHGGPGGGKGMSIRKSNPKARKSFRARHNCDNPGPRHKARYWSCRKW